MVVFFVPETRFFRGSGINPTNEPRQVSEATNAADIELQGSKDDAAQESEEANNIRKTVIQELNPWSGIDRNVSYLNVILRPFPLVVYPACAFAALACRQLYLSYLER